MINSVPQNMIKQPAPNIVQDKPKEKAKREIKRPYVGVLNPGHIQKGSIQEKINQKKLENPRMVYREKPNPYRGKGLSYQNISSLSIIGLSIISLLKLTLFKKH